MYKSVSQNTHKLNNSGRLYSKNKLLHGCQEDCCTYLFNYLLTFLLTPRSRVLLEKLIGSQLVKKFPAFYGTQRSIIAFTSAHHLSLSWAKPIQSMPPHPNSWRSILTLSSHLCLRLPSGLFPSGFPTKTQYIHLLSTIPVYTSPLHHRHYMPRPPHSSQFDHLHNIGWRVQIIKLLIMQFPPHTC